MEIDLSKIGMEKGQQYEIIITTIDSDGNTNDLSKTINKDKYKNCRNSKKKVIKELNGYLKNEFKCSNLVPLIKKEGMSEDVEMNVKYIILLILELNLMIFGLKLKIT